MARNRSATMAELLMVRRSVVPWVTLAGITVAGLVGGYFMFVMQDPARARQLGRLVRLLRPDSPDGHGGRAHPLRRGHHLAVRTGVSDGTAKDLLALPTSRGAVVSAKLLVAFAWCLALTLLLLVYAVVLGSMLALPGWSTTALLDGAAQVVTGGVLTVALCSTYALVASVARGYLAAFGAMFATLLAAQVVSAVGYGAWFPWAVPSLLAGAGGPETTHPGVVGIGSVVVLAAASEGATLVWWERADHPR